MLTQMFNTLILFVAPDTITCIYMYTIVWYD